MFSKHTSEDFLTSVLTPHESALPHLQTQAVFRLPGPHIRTAYPKCDFCVHFLFFFARRDLLAIYIHISITPPPMYYSRHLIEPETCSFLSRSLCKLTSFGLCICLSSLTAWPPAHLLDLHLPAEVWLWWRWKDHNGWAEGRHEDPPWGEAEERRGGGDPRRHWPQ